LDFLRNGEIRDEAEPGQRSGHGSSSLHPHMAADAQRKAAAGAHTISRAAHTVLVIDDNPAICYAMARSLRAGGYATIEALTGLEALQRLPQATALILDLDLPDVDGIELCRLVRANPTVSRIPIVHVSAKHTDQQDVLESARAGADSFFEVPVDPQQLLAAMDALLLREQR
jgi:DNA-binding response OmpR family regulator